MKIVYCLNSIRYIGGIQMVTVVKANALAEIPGNEVYVVVTDNKDGECVHKLSPRFISSIWILITITVIVNVLFG